jgi:3-hydroxyacyl-CoA dehydrogenase
MNVVRTEAISDVLLIEINNPPINAGSLGVRQGLKDAIARLAADPAPGGRGGTRAR